MTSRAARQAVDTWVGWKVGLLDGEKDHGVAPVAVQPSSLNHRGPLRLLAVEEICERAWGGNFNGG